MRVEDHHHAGVGDVDPNLDDGGRDEHVDIAVLKRSITASFFLGGIFPCSTATRRSGNTLVRKRSASSSALASPVSLASIAGATMYAWRPEADVARMSSSTRARRLARTNV